MYDPLPRPLSPPDPKPYDTKPPAPGRVWTIHTQDTGDRTRQYIVILLFLLLAGGVGSTAYFLRMPGSVTRTVNQAQDNSRREITLRLPTPTQSYDAYVESLLTSPTPTPKFNPVARAIPLIGSKIKQLAQLIPFTQGDTAPPTPTAAPVYQAQPTPTPLPATPASPTPAQPGPTGYASPGTYPGPSATPPYAAATTLPTSTLSPGTTTSAHPSSTPAATPFPSGVAILTSPIPTTPAGQPTTPPALPEATWTPIPTPTPLPSCQKVTVYRDGKDISRTVSDIVYGDTVHFIGYATNTSNKLLSITFRHMLNDAVIETKEVPATLSAGQWVADYILTFTEPGKHRVTAIAVTAQ